MSFEKETGNVIFIKISERRKRKQRSGDREGKIGEESETER